MFPSVKEKPDSKEKAQDKQWDDRLQKSMIPDYSPIRDKHTVSYKKILMNNSNMASMNNDSAISNNKKVKQKTYFQKKLQLLSKIRQLHKETYDEVKAYQQLLNKSGAPNFYTYFNLMPLLNMQDIKQYIFNQTRKLKQKSSSYHRISTSIRAREECLERIRKTLKKIKETDILEKKSSIKEEINHLRLLTSNVINQIKIWRAQLGITQQRSIYLTDDNKNYLIQLLNDNQFIFMSKLGDYINFGQKNDPFIIAPLKKAENKQSSQFLQIIQTQQLPHYQKCMEYLASQKAYQNNLNVNSGFQSPQKKSKSSSVHKIYSSTKIGRDLNPVNQNGNEDQDIQVIQKQKLRQQRLKKNQQRINQIKSIYQNFTSKKKLNSVDKKPPQTDIEDKKQTFKQKKIKKGDSQSDFEGLVKLKMQTEKTKKQKQFKLKPKKDPKSLSMTKLPKTEDKMIDNLRQIQTTLKNKLQNVQKEQKIEQSSLINSRYLRKTNEQLVNELKTQIIQKIERQNQQKQKLRRKKKQQQEKALQQIKLKMKKEMEQKLQQKKRQKILQREQLEKRLKQQQQRLNNQRQVQIQLQIKLNKEKQMRQLQKIRRESLQKQKKYKQQLQKEQKLRKQKQQAIQRQKKQKQKLLEQLKKKQLKEQIEQDLKKQLLEKKKAEDGEYMKQQLQALKRQKQHELTKQIQLLKLKQKDQLSLFEKENMIRQKMIKLKKQEEELKRRQLQALMKNTIQRQKQEIDREALQKRVQLEESMRANIKQKMLEQYRNEREAQIQANKAKRQKQLQQQVYRQKIREKIEKQMRLDAINRTKKELEQREAKKYEMRTRLDNIKTNIQNNSKLDKNQIEEQVKKEVIEKVIFDKNAERQNAKVALRAQFQRQLLSSAVPQIYEAKDSYLLKKTQQLSNEQNLNKKLQPITERPTNQKPSDAKQTNKSQIKDVRTIITNQQLEIFSKQKSKVSQMRQQPLDQLPTKLNEQQQRGYQLMNPGRVERRIAEGQYDIKVARKQKLKPKEQVYEKKKKIKKQQSIDSQDSVEQIKNRNSKRKKQKKVKQQLSQSPVSEDQDKKHRKSKAKKKKKKQNSQQSESYEKYRQSPIKKKIQFGTSQQQKKQGFKLSKKKKPVRPQSQQDEKINERQVQKKKNVIHYDAEQKGNKVQPNFAQIEPITIKKSNIKQVQSSNKFEITLDAIPEAELDQYLQGHFTRLPANQINIQSNDREQLYRKLISELTFCLLLGHYQSRLIGMAFAYHDRSRSDIRKFVIIHIGTYNTEDLKQFILNVSNFIFRKDPCDQIQFHYQYNENDEAQLNFSNQFNKWFDKYGNVYQKKLQNTQFERKYVLKRQFNQKCEVVLGGVNKNIFRNIFSVYSGVMMSDADLIMFKQELRDVMAPQDQISYAIMIAELFRTYLTPDEAEALKGKVKEFAKLKELLVLVVMLQKKKVKMDELKLYEYKSLIELNMKLMSQGKDVIRYCKDSGVEINRIYFCELSHGFNLPFNFQTTSLPVETKQTQVRQISYFRLAALPPYKLHIIRSSIYNGEMNILPTENSKYKLFVMNAQQYMELKDSNKMDLFMYIRLFLKNVKSHNVAIWKYVWMPQMMDKGSWGVREFKSFLNKDIYCHDAVNISYRQFLPGALIIEPDHRDLVITPPFIIGIMSMTLEQVTEGSPLYARLIDIDALRTFEIEN